MTERIHYNLSTANFAIGNISSNNLFVNTVTLSNLFVSNTFTTLNLTSANLIQSNISAATLNVTNATTTNILATNITTTTMIASSGMTVGNLNFTGTLTQTGATYVFPPSQWTTTNGNIFYTAGNVGIFNTAPTSALDISGGVRITGVASIGNLVVPNYNYTISNLVAGNVTTSNLNVGSMLNLGTSSGSATVNLRDISSRFVQFFSGSTSVGNINSFADGSQGLILSGSNTPNQFVLASSGNVGIGTTRPNFMLTMVGTGGSPLYGPHMAVYTNNDLTYPVFQQLNWTRDNISLNFDCFYDGNWRASSTNTAFQIYKFNNSLRFNYGNGSAGSNLGNIWESTALCVGSSGNVGINTASPQQKLHLDAGSTVLEHNGTVMALTSVNGNFGTIECFNRGNTSKLPLCLNPYGGYVSFLDQLAYYPLDVRWYYDGFPSVYLTSVNTASISFSNLGISLAASHEVFSVQIDIYSDERIKTNIVNIDNTCALNILRQLKPRQYNYKDVLTKGAHDVMGFVAQEVDQILPDAVSKVKDCIPNVYDIADVTVDNYKIILELKNKDLPDTIQIQQKMRLHVEQDGGGEKIIDTEIVEILDNRRFVVEQDVSMYDKVFVYGVEVDDFHVLDKNTIYTVTTAALQEVDTQLQETKEIVNELQKTFVYKGKVQLQNGVALVNLNTDSMTKNNFGLFEDVCVNPVKYLNNIDSFDNVRGSINGNILNITCENSNSNDNIHWMVVTEIM